MSKAYCVGVDVGGTYTDAVVLQGREIKGWSKVKTTPDVTSGVKAAIAAAIGDAARETSQPTSQLSRLIQRVNVGTTQFLNAVVQRRKADLQKVAVIRLCDTNTLALPPFVCFPDDLSECMQAQHRGWYFARGGLEYDRKPIAHIDQDQLKGFAADIRKNSVRHIVISGVFSSLHECGTQEEAAAACVLSVFPGASITLSHKVSVWLLVVLGLSEEP